MTNIATKNGSVILKNGSIAEGCGCCGEWYCYDNPCDYSPEGDFGRRWVCGEDQIPPATLSLKVTFSGTPWCRWGYSADEKGPVSAFQVTYNPSTRLNKTVTLNRELVTPVAAGDVDISGGSYQSYACAYVMPQTSTAGSAEGLYSLSILPGNPYPGDNRSDWDCFAVIGLWVDVHYDASSVIPYSRYLAENPSCSINTSGTRGTTGLGTYDCPRGRTNYSVYRCDGGRYTQPNHLLTGVKWTLTWESHPVCTLEVL